jgi:hypothetical protein
MDRTTITAALKPLRRRGLVEVTVDPDDGRSRQPTLTPAGRALLANAVPAWRHTMLRSTTCFRMPTSIAFGKPCARLPERTRRCCMVPARLHAIFLETRGHLDPSSPSSCQIDVSAA